MALGVMVIILRWWILEILLAKAKLCILLILSSLCGVCLGLAKTNTFQRCLAIGTEVVLCGWWSISI